MGTCWSSLSVGAHRDGDEDDDNDDRPTAGDAGGGRRRPTVPSSTTPNAATSASANASVVSDAAASSGLYSTQTQVTHKTSNRQPPPPPQPPHTHKPIKSSVSLRGGGSSSRQSQRKTAAAAVAAQAAAAAAAAAVKPSTRTRADTWELNLLDDTTTTTTTNNNNHNNHDHTHPTAVPASPHDSLDVGLSEATEESRTKAAAAASTSTPPTPHELQQRLSHPTTSTGGGATTTSTAAAATTIAELQEQWKRLWDSQSTALVDPSDICTVWDSLVRLTIHDLSPVQVTWLQRKIRAVCKALPPSPGGGGSGNHTNGNGNGIIHPTTVASKLVAKVMLAGANMSTSIISSSSSSGNHNNNATADAMLDAEARLILDRYHLLSPTVLQRVLPRSPIVDSIVTLLLAFGTLTHQPLAGPSSVAAAAATAPSHTHSTHPNGKESATNNNNSVSTSEANRAVATGALLTDRILTAAQAAVQQAGLQMNVNSQASGGGGGGTDTTGNNNSRTSGIVVRHAMPKPSQVPELNDPVSEWPVGATFTALTTVIALATTTTTLPSLHNSSSSSSSGRRNRHQRRAQRLQLLFYCLMDSKALKEFLASHPAGGIPVWLLEVGNSTVLSVPSLTHYHYYGNAFLPCKTAAASSTPSFFVPSKSRSPVTVSADRVQQVVRDVLRQAAMVYRRRTSVADKPQPHHHQQPVPNGTSSAAANHPFDEGRVSSTTAPASRKDGVSLMAPIFPPLPTKVPFRKSSSTNDLPQMTPTSSSHHGSLNDSDHPTAAAGNSNTIDKVIPNTRLMRKLHNVTEGVAMDPYSPMPVEIDASVTRFETATTRFLDHTDVDEWTLEEYKTWAEDALDDVALDVVMHRLFARGILPSPAVERNIVLDQWLEWQREMQQHHDVVEPSPAVASSIAAVDGQNSVAEILTTSVSALLGGWSGGTDSNVKTIDKNRPEGVEASRSIMTGPQTGTVWGGIGGIDGLGGLGYGVLYCIPRIWWESWAAYTGWSFAGDLFSPPQRAGRPDMLQTESLLEKDSDVVTRGAFGSYEVMKQGLHRGKHYVLVPPGVWDALYELYSGGPPLPRMVQPLERDPWSSLLVHSTNNEELMALQSSSDEIDESTVEMDLRTDQTIVRIPDRVSVITHPIILHVHLCDPIQPCRKGESGFVSIRVMACLNQPLWRLFGEIMCRFSLHSYKAFDGEGRGMARIWKMIEHNAKDAPMSRFGPWGLLCHSRHASILANRLAVNNDAYRDLIADWKRYGDNSTVESVGLVDQHCLMLEFAVQNKNGELTWPRELAAQAGKVRRLADEDKKLKQLLLGVGQDGKLLLKAPSIIGLEVDAIDSSGRWYTVKILEVKIVDDDTDEENDDEDEVEDKTEIRPLSKKRVRVSFREFGGHFEWIDVESDRITTAGRIVSETEHQATTSPSNGGTGGDGKSKSGAGAKRSNSNNDSALDNTKACALPGFGSCGLTNLGNTCYMNSAIQCMAYLPLLRAYLLSAQYKASGDLNKDNPLGTGGKLLEEFANMQKFIWSARIAEHTPNRFRAQLGKTNDQFSGADQQDAQEFLNYMIDVLHEDSNRVRKKPYVEALEDDWVEQTDLPRVGEEAWRRFERRNQSIMADVAMGQALNTVTCPVCRYSSRNFDPFNLLSIPIPTVADVIFQCTLIRRSTARNCPSILNRPRKNDIRPGRFPRKLSDLPVGPPSECFVAEQYVIALSRLADGGDLRLQLQNLCGIRANQLRLCRVDEVANEDVDGESMINKQTRVILLTDKEGPVSQHAKTRATEDGSKVPTQIIAFEMTLTPRLATKKIEYDEDNEATEAENDSGNEEYPSSAERAEIEEYLAVYGDEKECRQTDTDPLVIAMAVSRSLWPRNIAELKIGLRVDVKDHRGFWVTGSVVEVEEENGIAGNDTESQEVVATSLPKKIRIHPDIISPKWDEFYTIEHFKKGKVNPLYSQVKVKGKSTEFLIHHRCADKETGQPHFFGQSFYIQCYKEWTNARAGAHILAQTSRFLRQKPNASDSNRLVEKVQSSISELIDLLVDCDREFIKLVLGVSKHNSDEERARAYRNAQFDTSVFIAATNKKVTTMLHRLPFELRFVTAESNHGSKHNASDDEQPFLFALNVTVGNYVRPQSSCILHWRDPPVDKKNSLQRNSKPSILYVEPQLHTHESSAELLKMHNNGSADIGKKAKAGNAGIDLGFCLTEFCKIQKLPISDNWKCPRCKVIREGGQNMNLWRLPDLLTFHIKRFNMSARWHEKITTKVNFPMTGLDMSEWCHKESPVLREESKGTAIYDLIGVMNHYGSMTGGHYVAVCKATHCGRDGKEEVAYNFNGVGTNHVEANEYDEPSGFFLTRAKPKVTQSRLDATLTSQAVADSAEPMWLQFDDEIVEAIPPKHVVSEMAYVLFYRKRRITPSNIAKYSTLE